MTCFSQEKDELVLGFSKGQDEFYLKAQLTESFSALSFPVNFNRARANSVNLFPEIIGKKVLGVVQQENERSFYIQLEDDLALLFKLFGNRANLVLFSGEAPINLFRKKFTKDLDLRLPDLNRILATSKESFLQNPSQPEKLYPTFGDLPLAYLNEQGYQAADVEKRWLLLNQTLALLENPTYYLTKFKNKTRLSLLPLGEISQTFDGPIPALQEFVRVYLSLNYFEQKYSAALQKLSRQLTGAQNYLEKVEYQMLELEYDNSHSQNADLIMANLTQIRPGTAEITVYDFYNDQPKTLKLNPKETPQKYAERLYKKNKNRQIEIRYLQERAETKKSDISRLQKALNQLAGITTNHALKAFLKENELQINDSKKENPSLFRVFQTEGFKILVGKSAQNNDLLTQKHTYKEDLWLHAKDVSGSHVVIKYQANKNIPAPVLEKAAQLAAWYSKRKNDSLCPVLCTPKKFVRKPKGAEPGAVIVEREKVILVKPQNPFEQYPEGNA
jgi:hypothetical protein